MFRSLLAILVGVLITTPALASGDACKALPGESLGDLSILWVIPFAGLLLSIAIVPMVAGHWWHHNKNQLLTAVLWALPVLGYLVYLMVTNGDRLGCEAGLGLQHAIMEYVSFIALLGSLFIISGGILLKGDLQGKPGVNTAFLAVGALLANVIGTTGARTCGTSRCSSSSWCRTSAAHSPRSVIRHCSSAISAACPSGGR